MAGRKDKGTSSNLYAFQSATNIVLKAETIGLGGDKTPKGNLEDGSLVLKGEYFQDNLQQFRKVEKPLFLFYL